MLNETSHKQIFLEDKTKDLYQYNQSTESTDGDGCCFEIMSCSLLFLMLNETSNKQVFLEDKTKDLSQYKKLMKMLEIILKTNSSLEMFYII